MFKGLTDEIIKLNNSAKTVANCEKAKNLRKKLLNVGLPMAIIGYLGVFVCFILFSTAGFDAFGNNGFSARILVPFVLLVPFGFVASIGTIIAGLGFKILISGFATNLVDETVGNNCPNCGDVVTDEEIFCSKCGTKLIKECPNCKTTNSFKSNYCSKCGEKLV